MCVHNLVHTHLRNCGIQRQKKLKKERSAGFNCFLHDMLLSQFFSLHDQTRKDGPSVTASFSYTEQQSIVLNVILFSRDGRRTHIPYISQSRNARA